MAERILDGRRVNVRRIFRCKASLEEFTAEDGFHKPPVEGSKVEACPEDGTPHLSHKGGDVIFLREEYEDLGPAPSIEEARKRADAELEARVNALVEARLASLGAKAAPSPAPGRRPPAAPES